MPPLPPEPSARTLAAFLSGECSASEAADIHRWAEASGENTARLNELRGAWDAARQPTEFSPWNADDTWGAISARLDDAPSTPLQLVSTESKRSRLTVGIARRRNVAGWATALAACAAVIVGVWANDRAREQTKQPAAKSEIAREYRTLRGQRASGTLPDGSAFQLGPLSVLRVPDGYGASDRVVHLEGDAYFNVTHDTNRPFSVRTARSTIRDLGTRFIVRARLSEQRVEVAVAEGEVSIEPIYANAPPSMSARRTLMIVAGQVGLLDEHGIAKLLPHVSVTSRFAWTRGELVFEHVLVPDVLAELGRWYGDTFVLADKELSKVRLHTVLRGETLLEALVVLEAALDVDARVHGDTVTLTRHTKGER
jgi:transmembrane sensor